MFDRELRKEMIMGVIDEMRGPRFNINEVVKYNPATEYLVGTVIPMDWKPPVKDKRTMDDLGSENINDIGIASNYAEGKHVNFEHTGELPDSTQVRLYVADKFSNGDIINVYSYDKDGKKLTSVQKALEVKDGYISFDIENCAEYFITRSNVMDVVEEKKGINVFLIISIVELLVIVGLVVMLIIKSKKIDSEVGIKPSEVQPVVNEAVVAEPQIPAPTTPITEVRVEQNVTITENTIDNNIQNQ